MSASRRIVRGNLGYARPTATELRLEEPLLEGLATPALLARAMHCANAQGVSFMDALIACTDVDPEDVAARLAERLDVGRLTEDDVPLGVISVAAATAAVQAGVIHFPNDRIVFSLRGRPLIKLAEALPTTREIRHRIKLASPDAFARALVKASSTAFVQNIAAGPERVDAKLSARSRGIAAAAAYGAMSLIASAILATVFAPVAAGLAFAALFISLTALRMLAVLPDFPERAVPRQPDDLLPIYTVLVPLYREPACVGTLMRALAELDYPEAKLDIKILVEDGDDETRAELDRRLLPNYFHILTVPRGAPRTKPRALNAGLATARGSLLTVFDAEDRPEPGQLRNAVNAFLTGGPRLACVQARLAIDNLADGWLTRIFALEYAGLFDALLPALSRFGVLFPLGGTSNHFRTALLDRVGGWDAWNVTEDADLGLRLARLGYRTKVISSSTQEEAPNRLGAWLRQRTRWLKGYILTWAVHTRQPLRLYRELGLRNFLAFHAFIGGVALSALVLPVFIAGVFWYASGGIWLTMDASWTTWLPLVLASFNLILGFGVAMALAAIGADRRGLASLVVWIPTVPLYWLLSSIAAWRAVFQLLRAPFLWEKTEHGLARTSRQDDADIAPLTDGG